MGKVTDPAVLAQLNGQVPPAAPGVIYGQPKSVDPYKAPAEARAQRGDVRAEEDQDLQRRKFALDQEKLALDQTKVGSEQAKAGNFALRARDSLNAYDTAAMDPDSTLGQWGNQTFPNVTAKLSEDKRNAVRGTEREFIAAVLRYDSGAAIPAGEFESAYLTYFPSPSAGPEEKAQKKRARETALQGLMMGAGPAAAKMPPVAEAPTQPAPGGKEFTREDSIALWGRDLRNQDGTPLGPDGGVAFDADGNKIGLVGSVTDTSEPDARSAEIDAEIARRAKEEPYNSQPDMGDVLVQGGTFGLSDEIMGGATALTRGISGESKGYSFERDLYQRQLENVRKANPALSTATEIGGALMTGNANALLAPMTRGALAAQGAKIGAGTGAASGFGYGRGAEESGANALIGGTLGAPIGAAASQIGPGINALRNRTSRAPADLGLTLESGAPATAADVAAAGQAEGVTVRRAMVDPASRNKTAAVERTISGGPRIQSGLNDTRREIEAGVQRLGQGGTAQTNEGAGQTIADAAARYIDKSGKFFNARYDALKQAAGGVKVPPTNAGKAIDDIISGLSETPQMNSAEIAYLQKIKSDFSKDLSIDALRKARTKLRKDIAKGDLTFGDSEADVLAVMNAASDDITAGLTNAGKGNVAKRFAETDRLYRDRMEFIGGTIQKLIGRRNANLPPDQIIKNFRALPKRDVAGLRRFMDEMDPAERSDIAATFADGLGKTNNNEFSVSDFIKHAESIPESARRAIWGDAGEQSVKNLVLVSKALKAVPRGGSPTGIAQDYRGWLAEKLIGAGAGAGLGGYAGGDMKSAVAGAAAGGTLASVGAARNILTAKALMSPKITRWIATAPSTTSPAAINQHFQRLGAIAAQEPALAGDIQAIQKALYDAASQSPGKLAAEEKGNRQPGNVDDGGRKPPQQ
jgi:hypothetical protein